MSSSGKTVSSSANASNGWSRTNNSIRSVVSHPLALPLVLCLGFFDNVDTTNKLRGDEFMSYLQSLQSQPETISTNDVPSAEEQSVPSTRDRLLDMAWLVEDLKFTTTATRILSAFRLNTLHSNFKNVFNKMRQKGTTETALVSDILQTLRNEKAKGKNKRGSSLLFRAEGGVHQSKKSSKNPCRYDLLVARHERDSPICMPILLFEFGLDNSIWWQKLDQACKYLDLLTVRDNIVPIKLTEEGEEVTVGIESLCEKPVLMSTITVDNTTGAFRIALFLCWRRQGATGEKKMEPIFESMAQLAVGDKSKTDDNTKIFAEGFDMVFLWRTIWNPGDHGDLRKASKNKGQNWDYPGSNAFAKAMVAIFFAMQCLNDWQTNECIDNFMVLGPNCCKVKRIKSDSIPMVLRSYDTRLRPTSRSPHLYLNAKVKATYSEDIEGKSLLSALGRPLLYMAKNTASTNVRNFGDTCGIKKFSEMQPDWLWDSGGKLQLIETPFHESEDGNVHEAKRPLDFIPIINHLLHLHEQGFVHGDIRAFNMVFKGMEGKLIDFDFGGEVGKTLYPPGYKSTLPDSIRCGLALKPIEKRHDWFALGNVIFVFHKFIEPGKLSEQDKIRLTFERSEKSEISDKFDNLSSETGTSEASISELVTDLKDLLEKLDSKGWTCKASKGLESYYHESNEADVELATGSPKL